MVSLRALRHYLRHLLEAKVLSPQPQPTVVELNRDDVGSASVPSGAIGASGSPGTSSTNRTKAPTLEKVEMAPNAELPGIIFDSTRRIQEITRDVAVAKTALARAGSLWRSVSHAMYGSKVFVTGAKREALRNEARLALRGLAFFTTLRRVERRLARLHYRLDEYDDLRRSLNALRSSTSSEPQPRALPVYHAAAIRDIAKSSTKIARDLNLPPPPSGPKLALPSRLASDDVTLGFLPVSEATRAVVHSRNMRSHARKLLLHAAAALEASEIALDRAIVAASRLGRQQQLQRLLRSSPGALQIENNELVPTIRAKGEFVKVPGLMQLDLQDYQQVAQNYQLLMKRSAELRGAQLRWTEALHAHGGPRSRPSPTDLLQATGVPIGLSTPKGPNSDAPVSLRMLQRDNTQLSAKTPAGHNHTMSEDEQKYFTERVNVVPKAAGEVGSGRSIAAAAAA